MLQSSREVLRLIFGQVLLGSEVLRISASFSQGEYWHLSLLCSHFIYTLIGDYIFKAIKAKFVKYDELPLSLS